MPRGGDGEFWILDFGLGEGGFAAMMDFGFWMLKFVVLGWVAGPELWILDVGWRGKAESGK
jgi:hypothetical protein